MKDDPDDDDDDDEFCDNFLSEETASCNIMIFSEDRDVQKNVATGLIPLKFFVLANFCFVQMVTRPNIL